MADAAVTSRSLEDRCLEERELAASKVTPSIDVASEYDRHTETVERGEAEAEDPWAFAGDNESIDSFIAGCAPSCTAKAWIATQHDERKRRVEEYYEQLEGVEGAAGRESMAEISAAWEAAESKTLEVLTGVLKQHKYGCGKWMVFVPTSEVDLVWEEVVRALWEGKLGHTAKVSGAGPHSTGSHVICVYVDPFWEVSEVERVLAALRSECGIADAIKFKADGVTMLNLAKDNEFGIPPSFYAASRGSSTLQVQTSYNSKGPKKDRGGEWASGGGDGGNRDAGPDKKSGKHFKAGRSSYVQLDEDGFATTVGSKQSRKKDVVEPEEPTAADDEEKARKKAEKAKKKAEASGGFAALMGIDDGDADDILAKKRRKAEKKAAKKAAEEAQVAEESAANFAALKAKLASGTSGAWGDDDEEEEAAAAVASKAARKAAAEAEAAVEEAAEEEEEDEDEAEDEVAAAPVAAPVEPAKEKKKKALSAKEKEVEAMLALLETTDKEVPKEAELSKAAAKRAKKKAAGKVDAEAAAVAPAVEAVAAAEDEDEDENHAPKSAEEVRELMKQRQAAAKKKLEAKKGGSAAMAAAAAEAKAREKDGGEKKKKPKPTYQKGKEMSGPKQRGSDAKYQGE